ncbi:MAG: beta-eliminating lyase-related protein, partial [Desulfobacterales bacterium]|nr:beta-eliminating lyase-related protein [Desulfobacterales bacterium]
ERECAVFLLASGTACNALALATLSPSWGAIFCHQDAHVMDDECGAPERFTGCKLLTVPTADGKLTPAGIQRHLRGFGFEHHAQPRIVSITQATELGTVYTGEEIRAITRYAHAHRLLVHMDGARLANAAAALGSDLRELTREAGIDVLSFGGTKNGMLVGDAVVFFNRDLTPDFKYIRKQGMQLASKMRFIGAQFQALLSDDLWRRNAGHANRMAQLLAEAARQIPSVRLTRPVEANAVFAVLPPEAIPTLQKVSFFYVWDDAGAEVRWMTSFDTTEKDVQAFVALLQRTLGAGRSGQ